MYGYFHIRRGDAIEECDTSIEVIQQFLECSLNGTEHSGKDITILLGSDEQDMYYRQNITNLANYCVHTLGISNDLLSDFNLLLFQRVVLPKVF